VTFVQTYSFFGPQNDVGVRLLEALRKRHGIKGPADIVAPVGTANAYDAVRILAEAVRSAKVTTGPELQRTLEALPEVQGLIKTYRPPFSAANHEALGEDDYLLVRWKGGSIIPVTVAAAPDGKVAPDGGLTPPK
jgi:branched-chain amino acid transport system substrate-binding protein